MNRRRRTSIVIFLTAIASSDGGSLSTTAIVAGGFLNRTTQSDRLVCAKAMSGAVSGSARILLAVFAWREQGTLDQPHIPNVPWGMIAMESRHGFA